MLPGYYNANIRLMTSLASENSFIYDKMFSVAHSTTTPPKHESARHRLCTTKREKKLCPVPDWLKFKNVSAEDLQYSASHVRLGARPSRLDAR